MAHGRNIVFYCFCPQTLANFSCAYFFAFFSFSFLFGFSYCTAPVLVFPNNNLRAQRSSSARNTRNAWTNEFRSRSWWNLLRAIPYLVCNNNSSRINNSILLPLRNRKTRRSSSNERPVVVVGDEDKPKCGMRYLRLYCFFA